MVSLDVSKKSIVKWNRMNFLFKKKRNEKIPLDFSDDNKVFGLTCTVQ